MTLGIARAVTAPELTLTRTEAQWSKLSAAILSPATVYTARVNQTFTTLDGVLEITYDGGSGTLSNVKADMTLLIGSSAGAHDIGICRVKSADATKIYIGTTSNVSFANDQYLTILRDFGLLAKNILVSSGVHYMDGTIAYSDQHDEPDPTPIMGGTRVLKLTGATVSTQFDFSASYVVGALSTITGYATVAPTASSVTGPTTSTPTVIFDAVGWHPIYLTVTAANGKTMMGVRWVYVWDDDNLPSSIKLSSPPRQDVDTGGWQFSITLMDNVTLADVRDRALVVLFAEDHYGSTASSIGQLAGCENVVVEGWIAGEEIDWHPEQGAVAFTAYTAQHWLAKLPASPDTINIVPYAPTAWTQFQTLTVAKGLWHFLHWRSTATRIMDVFLPDDTKYAKEIGSQAGMLWDQLKEIASDKLRARPGVNSHNQLFIDVHPQLVPLASRTWATVMTITKADWEGEIRFERVVITPNSFVHLSGDAVDSGGNGVPYFSLSPGHSYPRYGSSEIIDNLLASSQAQLNSLAGLYRGWVNNQYPNITIKLAANNRMIECFPRQKCAIVIAAGDTPRGIAYSGNLIPTAVELIYNEESGTLQPQISFEAETFEDLSVNGDPPDGTGSGTIPGFGIKFPTLPDFLPIIPGDTSDAPNGPPVVLIADTEHGVLRVENFGESVAGEKPTWQFWNTGIDSADIPYIVSDGMGRMFITPNGAVYVAVFEKEFTRWLDTVYRAPFIGGVFVKIIDQAWMDANEASGAGILGIGYNPLKLEEVAITIRNPDGTGHFWLGADATWTQKVEFVHGTTFCGSLSFGDGKWIWDRKNGSNTTSSLDRFSEDGSTIEANVAASISPANHARAGTTAVIAKAASGADELQYSPDNGTTINTISVTDGFDSYNLAMTPDGLYMMANWDDSLGGGKRGRSPDGGASWSGIPALSPGGDYKFAYVGGSGLTSRWIAAQGTIWFSADFGATWIDKLGNLSTLIPTGIGIGIIAVPGFISEGLS